jgi:hypothetical protein
VFGPYYRSDPPSVVRKIVQSGELWGAAPRGYFRSDIPKVKAYAGHLPKDVRGFEFETEVEPDSGGVPDKPTWSYGRNRPGVIVEGEYARIRVNVLKTVLS